MLYWSIYWRWRKKWRGGSLVAVRMMPWGRSLYPLWHHKCLVSKKIKVSPFYLRTVEAIQPFLCQSENNCDWQNVCKNNFAIKHSYHFKRCCWLRSENVWASGNKVLSSPKKLMKNAILDFAKNLDLCYTNIFRQLNRAKRFKLIFRSEMGPLNQLKKIILWYICTRVFWLLGTLDDRLYRQSSYETKSHDNKTTI